MKVINVTLDSMDKVKAFVNAVSAFEGEFDLVSERYVVDAKSIMGIFSLNLSKPLALHIHDDAEADQVIAALKAFTV